MSGSLGGVLPALAIKPYDPFTPQQQMATITGTNLDNQSKGIANALAGINLGVQNWRAGVLGMGGNGGGAPGAGGPAGGMLAGIGTGSVPVPGAAPSGGGATAMPAAGGGGASGLPMAQQDQGGAPASPGPGGANAAGTQGLAEPGAIGMQFFGVPMPPNMAIGAAFSQNPNAMKDAIEATRQATYSMLSVPPAHWDAAVDRVFQNGFITRQTRDMAIGHPQFQEKLLQAYGDANSHSALIGALAKTGAQLDPNTGLPGPSPGLAAAAAAKTGAEEWAKVNPEIAKTVGSKAGLVPLEADLYARNAATDTSQTGPRATAAAKGAAPYQKPFDITVRDPNDPTKFIIRQVSPADAPSLVTGPGGAKPTTAANLADPSITVSGPSFIGRMAGGESSGNPAAGNPQLPGGGAASSAKGGLQFLDSTWTPLVKTYASDLAAGKTDAQIAAMRTDTSPGGQALQQRMGLAYAQQNAPALANAGAPVNSLTLGLAHSFGPAGAVNILSAPHSAAIAPLVGPDVMQANPNLRGKTVGQVLGNAYTTYGVNQVDLSGTAGGAAPGAAAAAGVAPPVVGAPPAAGAAPALPGIPGLPVLTPPQQQDQATLGVEREGAAKELGVLSGKIIAADAAAPVALQRLDVLENAAQGFRPGASAEMRLAAGKTVVDALGVIGIKAPSWLTDPTAAGETIQKEGGYLAAEMTRALGSREAASVFNQVRNIQPNIEMSQGGYQNVINSLRQGLQRDQDLAAYRTQWLADPAHGKSIDGMLPAFEKVLPVQVYASRVVPYPITANTSQKDLIPRVIYRSGDQVRMWDGRQMQPVPAQ